MAIDLTSQLAKSYIETLKSTRYVDPTIQAAVTQASNYSKIIDIVSPTVTDKKESVHRLLEYYVRRYNQVTKVIDKLETKLASDNVEVEYGIFNDYTVTYLGRAPEMDEMAGLLNYSLDFTIDRLRSLRREQKVLSQTLADLANIVDEYTNMDATFADMKSRLA